MERRQWRPMLERWSEDWISARRSGPGPPLDEEVVRTGWLGFEPATPERIAEAQERLGCTLPPSLREFFLVTDGWRDAGPFVYGLAGTGEIGWLRDLDAHWIDSFGEAYDDGADDEWAVSPLLRRSLQISTDGDLTVLFLDPEDVNEAGEWAAYQLSSWSGMGPERYESFRELMYDLFVSVHRLERPQGTTRRELEAEVEQARLAALHGEVDGPLETFTEAARFGHEQAELMQVQMQIMLGEMHAPSRLAPPAVGREPLTRHPMFERELLPLLLTEQLRSEVGLPVSQNVIRSPDHHKHPPAQMLPLQQMIADYRAKTRRTDFRLDFGEPTFDRAVQTVLGRLRQAPAIRDREGFVQPRPRSIYPFPTVGESMLPVHSVGPAAQEALDQAWQELRAAIPLWRPLSHDHIAPIILRADPLLTLMITPERGREILAIPRSGQ
ncbi:hypothetical protein GCM10023085_06620 [Actinomadura viridis]|uniref:Knr4/Smi1-like domain-containing protein n=1 Tax=Actinomadura viridis TaxID=58110 RepID=A0A931DPI2_9ACTN|nr:SMI1/KNR4 family protein [Actinomadura viridis]MBG6091677.1 hypothetical protein [Actinomadura viridis]